MLTPQGCTGLESGTFEVSAPLTAISTDDPPVSALTPVSPASSSDQHDDRAAPQAPTSRAVAPADLRLRGMGQ